MFKKVFVMLGFFINGYNEKVIDLLNDIDLRKAMIYYDIPHETILRDNKLEEQVLLLMEKYQIDEPTIRQCIMNLIDNKKFSWDLKNIEIQTNDQNSNDENQQ